MTSDDYGSLIYLALLGAFIASYFFMSRQESLGELARAAALWGFIFLGVIVTYGMWNDISRAILPRQSAFENGQVEVPRRNDGHFYLTLHVGEVPVEFVVDTGATSVVLSKQDAQAVGINPDELIFGSIARTANGEVRTARVTLEDVRLGDLDEGRVRAFVNEGELDTSLLGMSYLQRFDTISITGDKLVLQR